MGDYLSELLIDVKRDAITKFDATKDVQPVLEAIATVIYMSNVGRKEGLLALEAEFVENPSAQDADVSSKILLVVDGYAPELIAEILTNEYWANKYEGNDALAQYILMRGVLLVQEGENPLVIKQMLKALLPKEFYAVCDKYIKTKEVAWQEEADAKVLEQFRNWKPVKLENESIKVRLQEIEALVVTLNDRAMQRVMREVDNADLAVCAAVFSEKGRKLILKNMSNRLRLMIIRELLHISAWASWSKEDDILAAAEKIEQIIFRLEGNGEIILF